MKTIVYRLISQNQSGSHEEFIEVRAKNINSGARKAADIAVRQMDGFEFVSLTFWAVQ